MLSPAYPNQMAACTYAALTLVRCGVNRSRVACGHAALILSGVVGTAVVDLSRGLPRTLRDELVLLATLSTYHPPARHVNAGNQNGWATCRCHVAGFLFLWHCSERLYTYRQSAVKKGNLMPDDVDTLETKRSKLLEEFLGLGDLRPGSLTAVMRRCGKPSCHCAKRNDPGHDPQFRLTRRVAGKTVTETFPNPTALRKAQQEVTEFHRFQKLSQDLVALNEKICRLRPVEQQRGGWTEQEKKTLLRSMRK